MRGIAAEIDHMTFFQDLWSDVIQDESFPARRPLLAHYTSVQALERIMVSGEMWFSNPLFMNDMEELRFGLMEGARAFREHSSLPQACGSPERHRRLVGAFDYCFSEFEEKHALDTYVLCFSEHDQLDTDGVLSMWRGYGSNGNGAAIIVDTAKINANDDSPLIIANVTYATREKRLEWIDEKLWQFAELLKRSALPDDKLYVAAYELLERLKIFALFTKHCGFREEKEWRFVYLSQRDHQQQFSPMLHYAVGERGVEPKLKFKIQPIAGLTDDDLSIEKIVHEIILGPSVSSVLARKSITRMLEKAGKPVLVPRVKVSTTPFRVNN
jgi:hypothetical protein